ncbi:hypothetical protein IWX75_000891 [Arthrobacter sp. CAN_A6]
MIESMRSGEVEDHVRACRIRVQHTMSPPVDFVTAHGISAGLLFQLGYAR